jgi:hypothetical protein
MQEYDLRVDAEKCFLERGWMTVDGESKRRPIRGIWATVAHVGRHLFEILVERDDEYQNKTLVRRLRRAQSLREAKMMAWSYVEPHLMVRHEKRQSVKAVLIKPQEKTSIRPSIRSSVRSDRYAVKHKATRRPTFRPAQSVRA